MSHLNRIFLACRRGMWELDLLFEPFAHNCLEKLPAEEFELFESLLTQDDPDLFSWFMAEGIPDDQRLIPLIKKIKDYAAEHTL